MENVKIIETIKKLFELSKNNPSEEEAKSAALKAHEMLAKHGIDISEVENLSSEPEVEEITEESVDVPAKKWKYTLAHAVADNCRVQFFMHGKNTFIFYGHKTDVSIAVEMFKYLFDVGNKLGLKLYREIKASRGYGDNVYNSCVMGFCEGVREALAEQSKALMVIMPEDVKEAFAERTKGFRVCHNSRPNVYHGEAFRRGRESGYNAMKRNALNG